MEKDPVCGMQVDPNAAGAKREVQGRTYYFCSQGCATKFDQSPQQYLQTGAPAKPAR